MSGNWRDPIVPEGAPLLYRSWANYNVYNFTYSIAYDVDRCGQSTIYSRFQGLASTKRSAALEFGICCEESVVENLRIGGNPEQGFIARWMKLKDVQLDYSSRDDSWSHLFEIGKALMRQFLAKRDKPPFSDVLVNCEFGVVFPTETTKVWHNGTRLEYIADLVANPPSGRILLDLKTAASTYAEKEGQEGYCALDPQLVTGSLCSGIRRVGFIALVKTQTPKIDFVEGVVSDRALESTDQWLREQYDKIMNKRLFMRMGVRWPNDHCKMCDFLPKCLGDEETAARTLRKKQSKDTASQLVALDEL